MKSGVYIILNIINNKYYIGSSKNVYIRLREHKSNLKGNKHENQRLQNAVNKYGINNFEFESVKAATEFFNGGQGTITKVLKNPKDTAYGFKWKYK